MSKHLTVTADDYVVIMTRGHQADYEVLTQVLRSGAASAARQNMTTGGRAHGRISKENYYLDIAQTVLERGHLPAAGCTGPSL